MCGGRRYLDAVLGRDLRDAPSRVRSILEGGGPTPSSAGHLPAFSTLQRAGLLWIRPARDGQVAHLVELDVDRSGPGGAPGLGKGALARAGGSREHMTIRAPPRAPYEKILR